MNLPEDDLHDLTDDFVMGPHFSVQFQGRPDHTVSWLKERPALNNPDVVVYSYMDMRYFDVKTYLMLFGKKK